jgi:hypothetical protein
LLQLGSISKEKYQMRFNIWTSSLTILIIPVLIGVIGCTSPDRDNDSEHTVGEEQAGHLPTHGEEGGEGEESGLELAKNQTHDQVRNGARLTLRLLIQKVAEAESG